MFRNILILIIALLISEKSHTQDPGFTRFFTNPVYYNPALSAADDGLNLRMNYRNFWRKADNGLNTVDFTINSNEPFLSGGIGAIVLSGIEGNGVIQSNMAGISYAYNLVVKPRYFDIQMGLQGAWVQKKFITNNLIFSDQLDPLYGVTGSTSYSWSGADRVVYPDFSTGINFRINAGSFRSGHPLATINAGAAFHHLTRPNESFTGLEYRLPVKSVFYTNSVITLHYHYNRALYLTPAAIYEQQSVFKTLVFGCNIKLNPVYAGIWFRNQGINFRGDGWRAVAIAAGIEINTSENISLQAGYSYEINISELQNMLGNTHEVSLRLRFNDVSIFGKRSRTTRKAKDNRTCFNKF